MSCNFLWKARHDVLGYGNSSRQAFGEKFDVFLARSEAVLTVPCSCMCQKLICPLSCFLAPLLSVGFLGTFSYESGPWSFILLQPSAIKREPCWCGIRCGMGNQFTILWPGLSASVRLCPWAVTFTSVSQMVFLFSCQRRQARGGYNWVISFPPNRIKLWLGVCGGEWSGHISKWLLFPWEPGGVPGGKTKCVTQHCSRVPKSF